MIPISTICTLPPQLYAALVLYDHDFSSGTIISTDSLGRKEEIDMIALKYISKDLVNWWLSYLLSQPVELDVMIVLYLVLQYIGVVQLLSLLKQVKPYLFPIGVSKFKKESLEAVAG